MSAASIVSEFIRRVVAKDFDGALELVTEDVEYDNVPIAKVVGPEAVRGILEPFLGGCTAAEWVVLHQIESGDVVMNERIDRFEMAGRWIELPVAGLFVIRDGRIALWRDYFDAATLTRAMSGD